MQLDELVSNEAMRRREFPVTGHRVFLAHAGVAPLPRAAVAAMNEFLERGSKDQQETAWTEAKVRDARRAAATLLGCRPDEISLLGPTSLGLNLIANGLDWDAGDEVVHYRDDYPANVYPWAALQDRGVRAVSLHPKHPGAIAWPLVEAALTPRTRLVALASCNFLSGYRIDLNEIGRNLHERGILFCVDAIQTLGAFPTSVKHVDFLSADSHKWMLGPAGAGILYVRATEAGHVRPTLLGSWNVVSPQFVAQPEIQFEHGGRRYEPGMLNLPGIVGMGASIELLLEIGVEAIGARILELRRALIDRLTPLGFRLYLEDPDMPESAESGIVSVHHPDRDMRALARRLEETDVAVSLRQSRFGQDLIRISPHFYNIEAELERVADVLV